MYIILMASRIERSWERKNLIITNYVLFVWFFSRLFFFFFCIHRKPEKLFNSTSRRRAGWTKNQTIRPRNLSKSPDWIVKWNAYGNLSRLTCFYYIFFFLFLHCFFLFCFILELPYYFFFFRLLYVSILQLR